MAYADLGGLGPKQGAPVAYNWVASSLAVAFLPWLAILALLLLKPNRCASAWWIWLPLACVGAVACAPESIRERLPAQQFELFLELISALGFGLAAVWLLSGYLGWKHRMLAFVGILFAQEAFSGLACLVRQGLGPEGLSLAVFMAVSAAIMSAALTLAGVMSRGRSGWVRLSLWLVAALVVVCLVVIGPFFLFARIMNGGNIPVMAFFAIMGVAVAITFGVLLPFLVLSFANGFYGERLKALLHLGGVAAAPPVITPPLPAVAGAAGG